MGQKRDLKGNYGKGGQRRPLGSGDNRTASGSVRNSQSVRRRSTGAADTRKETRMQSDSDHTRRKHRVLVSR